MTPSSPSVSAAGYPPAGGPPGGFGGPPGGGPPGGFGGPPGGGPPGGFGGPPGGGPPGGFGGPPGGGPPGGFGGPPGGFGGPPGGFGGPPGGFGGPPGPMGGPSKSGSNLGLIIGLGCGGLFVIGLIVTLIIVFATRKSSDDETTASDKKGDESSETDEPKPKPPPPSLPGKVELQDIRFFTSRSSSSLLYVVGELVNTGGGPANAPRAKITVYDAGKTALDSGTCDAWVVHDLQANEKVPCQAIMSKAKGWKTYKVETETSKSYLTYKAADLKISDVDSVAPSNRYNPHKVSGKISNSSPFTAKSVWVLVGLYDADGKVAGAGKTMVAGNDIEPGGSAAFTVSIYNVATPVKKSLTKVFGYDK